MVTVDDQTAVFTAVDIGSCSVLNSGSGSGSVQSSGIIILGIGGAVEAQFDAVSQSLLAGDGGFAVDGEAVGKSMITADGQIAVNTAINALTGSAVVGHGSSGSSCDFSIGSGVGTFQSQLSAVDKSLSADNNGSSGDLNSTVVKGMSTMEIKVCIGTVVKSDIFKVSDLTLIISIACNISEGSVTGGRNTFIKANLGVTGHNTADIGTDLNVDVICQSMITGNGQIVVETPIDALIVSAVVDNCGVVFARDRSGTGVLTAQGQAGIIKSQIQILTGEFGSLGHGNVASLESIVEAIKNKGAVSTVVKLDTGFISHPAFISSSGSSDSSEGSFTLCFSIGIGKFPECHIGFAAHDTGDIGIPRNAEVPGQLMVAVDGQVIVSTAIDISCSGIFNTSAVDGGSIVFSIGRTVEFHGHVIGKVLCIADLGFARNTEAVSDIVIIGNGQVVVGTCVNFGISTVVFDIAAGNGGVIAFSIGAAVEFNGHTGSHGLSAADRGKTRNAEVALQFVSLNNGQVAVTAGAGAVNGGILIVDHK